VHLPHGMFFGKHRTPYNREGLIIISSSSMIAT
jgi:hypothetical protein